MTSVGNVMSRYELLGPTLLKRCHAACATVERQLFGW